MPIKNNMNAAVLYKARDLRFEQVPTPRPAPDEVLIEIKANGLCGSDIHFFEDGKLGPYRVTRPYIPGHESCGVVVAGAASGKGPSVGQRVAIEPGIPCRKCALCKSGRYNLCNDVVFLSAPPVNGTFAEYAAVAADFAHPLPDNVSDEAGAFVEPISVAIQACTRANLKAADTVAVLGAGPIGLITILVARAFGATQIYAVDVLPNRLSWAHEHGVTSVVNANQANPADTIAALTGQRGVDIVFDTSGSSDACAIAPIIAARGGIVTLVGWPEKSLFPYPIEMIIEKEIDVRGVNRYCNTYQRAISLLASGSIDVKPLITSRYDFKQVCEAFEFASANRKSAIKVLVLNT